MFQVSGHSVMQGKLRKGTLTPGQAVYFSFFSADRSPSAISRYINESRRVYGVLEMKLSEQREALLNTSAAPSRASSRNDDRPVLHFQTDEDTFIAKMDVKGAVDTADEETPVWLVGNSCSVADISFLTWANVVDRIGIDLETEFPVRTLRTAN
jgi:glutathione S-transferase